MTFLTYVHTTVDVSARDTVWLSRLYPYCTFANDRAQDIVQFHLPGAKPLVDYRQISTL